MRTYDEAYAAASPRAAFSNGTAGDIWMDRWCYRCRRDSPALVDAGNGCSLIMVAFMGRTPAEWHEQGIQDYRCDEFVERRDGDDDIPPAPDPDPDAQLTIFDEFADQLLDELTTEPAVAR